MYLASRLLLARWDDDDGAMVTVLTRLPRGTAVVSWGGKGACLQCGGCIRLGPYVDVPPGKAGWS